MRLVKFIILFSLNLFSSIGSAQALQKQNTEWTIVSSSVTFKIKNAGMTVNGSFTGLNAKLVFDPSKNAGNFIQATIDAGTIDTDNKTRDGHLRKAEYFDVENYSKISLVSTFFGKDKENFRGYFNLAIKGKTKAITVPFSFTDKNGKGVFKASFTINRLDYGVGESSIILSDYVVITIEANVQKK